MTENTDMACRQRSWLVAAAGGLVVFLLLMLIGHFPFGTALFFGLLFLVLFGGFIGWAFCTGKGYDLPRTEAYTARPIEPVKVVSAPTPRPEPAAAPAAAPAALMETAVRRAEAAPAAAPVAAAPVAAAPAVAPVVTKADKPAKAPAKAPAKPKEKAAASAPAAATRAKAAPKAPAKAPAKAAAPKAEAVVAKPAAKAAPRKTAAKATGLDAAMGKTKDAPAPAATPTLLTAPRGGKADDLKLIIGIGPALEKLLNSVGVWHFDQIASWKAKDIAFVDGKMERFHGRISRDEWVKQAKILAKGGTVEDLERAVKGRAG